MPCPINHKILSLIKGVEPIPLKKAWKCLYREKAKYQNYRVLEEAMFIYHITTLLTLDPI